MTTPKPAPKPMFDPPSGAEDLDADLKALDAELEAERLALEERRAELLRRKAEQTAARAAEDVEDEPVTEPAPWPHGTIDYHGLTLEIRRPPARALEVLGLRSVGNDAQAGLRLREFLQRYMSPTSFETFLDALEDPDSGLPDNAGSDDLLKKLATFGTARPTKQS